VHLARWQDKKFRICRDKFLIGIVLSLVYFDENYNLQLKNEVQSQYYHLDKVIIMVHITYIHGSDSIKQNIVILKEYHFYISDDKFHDLAYIQHCFQLFYSHVKKNNIQMDQDWIWLDGCTSQFKNSRVFQ
jgi:hypothetical protein